jgi:hypothetical protein
MDALLDELLTHLHQSIDLLATDLMRDRPDLARALRVQTAGIPQPERERSTAPPPSAGAACARLPPLLYGALDAGVVDARKFDRLMLLKTRAACTLRGRR